MIKVNERHIDLVTSGAGPDILFVPGSFSTPAAWQSIQKHLPQRYRFLGTSLCGYGETTETRTLCDNSINHEIEILSQITASIQKPVHLVGHSFGGLVCFAAILMGKLKVKSLTTFEANPITLLEEKNVLQFRKTRKVSEKFERQYFLGEKDAVKTIIDFWGGRGSFSSMPKVVQEYCRSTGFANVLDWRTALSFKTSSDDFKNWKIPCLIVRGEHANHEMIEITDVLSKSIPDSKISVVTGANHFLISSHPAKCANLLANFLQEID